MYLSAKAIAEMEGEDKTHFLNKSAVRNNKSLGDAVGLQSIGVHVITVPPGYYSTELHCHFVEEECIYVLAGSGKAIVGDETYPLGPGDFIGCRADGVAHTMKASGDKPLVCLVMGQRLAHDVTDYPAIGKRLYRIAGAWSVVEYSDIQHIER